MNHFALKDGALFAEDVAFEALASSYGTPLYVYSAATLRRHARAMLEVLQGIDGVVCYAVKASSSLGILSLLAREGLGFDIVSGGELERVLRAGGDPSRVVFSGVGKSDAEMRRALEVGIRQFNVESEPELLRLDEVAGAMGRVAKIAIRVNPEVDAQTHPYIATSLKESKFGVPIEDARALFARCTMLQHIKLRGVACHIGSQIGSLAPFSDALDRVLEVVAELRAEGHALESLDIGGGLGVPYKDETMPTPVQYGALVRAKVANLGLEILLEPGRLIVANAGVLLTRVHYVKKTSHKSFVVVDAAMNDLLRPALYQAFHAIDPVRPREGATTSVDVVGPVCESGDFFAKSRDLAPVQAHDLLCIRSAGAYGFAMASQYNSRPRAAEILVSGERAEVLRARETLEDLVRGESVSTL
jgi:diaminopimelate decarboxylase